MPGIINKTYQYYADGRMDYSHDLGDARYDRKNKYDQVGSLTTALSGAEALGLPASDDRPYNQTYQHDVWGNMTNREGRQWASNDFSQPATYSNDRHDGWNYDAAGNWLDDGTYNALQRKYDAAGRLTSIVHPAYPNNPKRTDDFDGDGQRLRSGYHNSQPEYALPLEYTYYLRSSVLGGQIISEIRGNGQKAMGYVYDPTGRVIAVQKLATPEDVAAYVLWRHAEPSKASVRATDLNGSSVGSPQNRYNAELDPLGADNALTDPGQIQLYEARDDFSPGWLLPSSAGGKCKLDGMSIDCSEAMERQSMGNASQCENNYCGPQTKTDRDGQTHIVYPEAYADGYSGLVRPGSRYLGGGKVEKPGGEFDPDHLNTYSIAFNHASVLPQNTYDPRVDFRDYAEGLSKNKSIDDCQKLALMIYKAGQVFGGSNSFSDSGGGIVAGLMAGLTEFTRVAFGGREGPSDPNYRVGVFGRDSHYGGGFGDSGFSGGFQDGSNQVRHFTFYLGAGWGIGSTLANRGLYREEGTTNPQVADVGLGLAATDLGSRFDGNYKQLAQDVWHSVCEQSSDLKFP